MAIQIKTASVRETAKAISEENKVLLNSYNDIDSTVTFLKHNWTGNASDVCCEMAKHIKDKFKTARYDVVEDFVRFMLVQVGEGYERTEQTLTTAADAFK